MIKEITQKSEWQKLLVVSTDEKEQKNGDPYTILTLADGEQMVEAKVWSTAKTVFEEYIHTVADISIYAQEYNGSPSYIVTGWRKLEPAVPITDFIPTAGNVEEMYKELMEILERIRKEAHTADEGDENPLLAIDLSIKICKATKNRLMLWPAAERNHHALYGGLLLHTLTMVKAAEALTAIYPNVNKQRLIAGTALHDIGKIFELKADDLGHAEYTIEGRLLGHLLMGVITIDRYQRGGNYDSHDITALEHLVASHHGRKDYGAIQEPMSREAIILHHLDMIDSREFAIDDATRDMGEWEMTKSRVFGAGNVYIVN